MKATIKHFLVKSISTNSRFFVALVIGCMLVAAPVTHAAEMLATTGTVGTVTGSSAVLNGQYAIGDGTSSDYLLWFQYGTDSVFSANETQSTFNSAVQPALPSGPFHLTVTFAPSTTVARTFYFRLCITKQSVGQKVCGNTSAPFNVPPVETTGGDGSGNNNGGGGSGNNNGGGGSNNNNGGGGQSNDTTNQNGDNTIIDSQKLANPLDGVGTIPDFIAKILSIITKIATPFLVCFFIYTGFLFVRAQGNEKKLEEAKSTLLWAIIGGALILGAWVLANAISGTISQL